MSPPSPGRRAVYDALRAATLPMTVEAIAAATRLPVADVRMHISNLKFAGTAVNVGTGAAAQYVHRTHPAASRSAQPGAPVVTPQRTHSHLAGQYDGRELQPYTCRPGAMDAYALPSLRNGQREPRRAPFIMGAQPVRKAVQP